MKEITLPASARVEYGKNSARRTRVTGRIPGVMYGPDVSPTPISVDEKEFRSAVKAAGGTSTVFNLNIDGKESKVILRELQRDPVSSKVLHIDFHAISMNKPIHISVPIHFMGLSEGVKNEGGIMQTTMRELEVSCLPSNIPEHFEIDVTNLRIGESIHVRDVSIPNAEIISEEQRTIVVISAPTVMKVEEPVAEEGEAAVAPEDADAPAEGEGDAKAKEGEGAGEAKKEEKK